MENQRRRGRRRSRVRREDPSALCGNKSLLVAVVLCLGILMIQHNCKNRVANQELMKITSSVDDVADHLNEIQVNYRIIEEKLAEYTEELPKLVDQLAALEELAQALEYHKCGWDPRLHPSLPYVDVKLSAIKLSEQIPRNALTECNVDNDNVTASTCTIMYNV